MRILIHLSDLHFGHVDPALLAPLTALVASIAPDLVVVSGDLTQRARKHEFQAARDFLDALPAPWLVVPGNHDVPMYNVARRFLTPLTRYRRYFGDQVQPEFVDDEIAVLGVNTARALTIKDGRINAQQISAIRTRFDSVDPALTKILVSHHPFDLPAPFGKSHLVGSAALAMATFADCGVDLLLAGHLHASHAGNSAARHKIGAYAALMVQAGTATSTRGRGESNSFNVLHVAPGKITVQRYTWLPDQAVFAHAASTTFVHNSGAWSDSAASSFGRNRPGH
ncbi:MAG: 3',5'-cyclic AMP phosphodiesterase CpdA [Janthinobacterium sp.]|jgi:3',5'-cyclic AMP phosphodiesterase CpdA